MKAAIADTTEIGPINRCINLLLGHTYGTGLELCIHLLIPFELFPGI